MEEIREPMRRRRRRTPSPDGPTSQDSSGTLDALMVVVVKKVKLVEGAVARPS